MTLKDNLSSHFYLLIKESFRISLCKRIFTIFGVNVAIVI